MNDNSFQGYFITSPTLYSDDSVQIFKYRLEKIFSSHCIHKACFRDNSLAIKDIFVQVFSQCCFEYNIESFINLANTNLSFEFAQKYDFKGVHIKGNQFHSIKNLDREQLKIFYSAHQTQEIFQALDIGVDFVTISPIFYTPSKPTPLGIEYINNLDSNVKKQVFALGGIITTQQIQQVKESGLRGFASIRYFLKNL